MKIVKQTAIELVLNDTDRLPIGLLAWLTSLIAILLVLLGVTLASAGVRQLECYRLAAQVSCEYRQSYGFDLIRLPQPRLLTGVSQVWLEERINRNSSDAYAISRVALMTQQGEFYLTSYHSDRQKNDAIVKTLTYFMESTTNSVRVEYDTRWQLLYTIIPFITFSILLGISLVAFYRSCQVITITIHRPSGRLIYQQWALLGQRRRMFPVSAIEGIYIRERIQEDSHHLYEPILLSKVLPEVVLLQSTSLAKAKRFAEQVRAFLQLPAIIENG